MNKEIQISNATDLFKAIVTGMIGTIFLSTLIPIVSPTINTAFLELGLFLITAGIIAFIVALIFHPLRK